MDMETVICEKGKVKRKKVPVCRSLSTGRLKWGLLMSLLFMLGFTTVVSAQITDQPIDRPEELRILDSYFQIAVEQNPELESLRLEIDAQQQRSPQVRALPDPEIGAGFYLNPVTETSFPGRFSFNAMQMFPWFGTLDTRGQVEESIGNAMFHSLNARQLKIFDKIQALWFQYYQLNHHVHIHTEMIEIVRNLESLIQARYETGRAGQADLLRIQMEEQRIRNTIEELEDEKNPLREEFNALLNRDSNMEIQVPTQLPERVLAWTKKELFEFAQNHHPDFNRIEAQRDRFKTRIELARLEGYPSFGVGVEYMGRDFGMMSMMDLDNMFIGMATVRIPLYRGKYRAQRKEAQLRLQATDHLEIDLANRLNSELEKAMKSLRDAQRDYRLITEELLPRSKQVFNLLSDEYRTGQVRFDEILQVLRELLALENEQIEALAAQNKAMAAIEQLVANELTE